MKIAILTDCSLKEQQLKRLKRLGDVALYDDTDSEEKAISRLNGINIAIADAYLTPLNEKVFNNAKNLQFVAISSTGFDVVDLTAAKKNKIKVANIPGFSTEAVAEQAIALMFAVLRKIPRLDKAMRQGPFELDPGKDDTMQYIGTTVKGKTLGIIGLGDIGKRVAEMGQGLGMQVVAYNRTPRAMNNVQTVSLEKLLKKSDVISVSVALNSETQSMISTKEFGLMKPSAIIVNTARGKVIDENAMTIALQSRKIAGAGLDVLADWSADNRLCTLENVVLTPHAAWFTDDSLDNMAEMLTANVEAFVSGNPMYIVNE